MLCCTWNCVSTAISGGLDIPNVSGCHFLQQIVCHCGSQKINSRINVSLTQSLRFWFIPLFSQNEMVILSTVHKPDNFQSHISLRRTFTDICGLDSNFTWCASFLESKSLDIFALRETNVRELTDFIVSLR